MRFEIDTTAKRITLKEEVNLAGLFKLLEDMIPDWKDYKISNSNSSTTNATRAFGSTNPLTGNSTISYL